LTGIYLRKATSVKDGGKKGWGGATPGKTKLPAVNDRGGNQNTHRSGR